MIKDILSISANDVEMKRLFNQDRDIFHYRRERLQTKIIKTLMMLHMHTNRNSDIMSNINDDLKSNDRNSKNESKNDFRDIDVFVKAKLNNESNVSSDNDSDNLMKKSVNLNNANDFESNEFDDLRDENFDDFFVNSEIASKQTDTQASISKSEIRKRHRQSQFSLNISRKRTLKDR